MENEAAANRPPRPSPDPLNRPSTISIIGPTCLPRPAGHSIPPELFLVPLRRPSSPAGTRHHWSWGRERAGADACERIRRRRRAQAVPFSLALASTHIGRASFLPARIGRPRGCVRRASRARAQKQAFPHIYLCFSPFPHYLTPCDKLAHTSWNQVFLTRTHNMSDQLPPS